jgi:hypothetical protein
MYVDDAEGVGVDWDEVAELIEEAFRLVASKRSIALLDRR